MSSPKKSAARDPERTRTRLLDAAEEELGARGFHGARVRAIVDGAGCNERMLYHYFGDKEGLYRAVIERALGTTAADIGQALTGADFSDIRALLERALRAFGESFHKRPSFARLIFHEALNGFQSFPKIESEPGDPMIARLLPLWKAAAERGEIRPEVDLRVALTMGALLFLAWPISIPRVRRLFPERDLESEESLAWAREQMIEVLMGGVSGAARAPDEKKTPADPQRKRRAKEPA